MKKTFLAGLALFFVVPCWALEFRTTARPAILYDGPSQQATKMAVAGMGVPFEIFVETDIWTKVRDANGRLAWIEKSALGNAHQVMVNASEARIYKQPTTRAEVRFRAAHGVLLVAQGAPNAGWIEVRQADGMSGWVQQHEVWGE